MIKTYNKLVICLKSFLDSNLRRNKSNQSNNNQMLKIMKLSKNKRMWK